MPNSGARAAQSLLGLSGLAATEEGPAQKLGVEFKAPN